MGKCSSWVQWSTSLSNSRHVRKPAHFEMRKSADSHMFTFRTALSVPMYKHTTLHGTMFAGFAAGLQALHCHSITCSTPEEALMPCTSPAHCMYPQIQYRRFSFQATPQPVSTLAVTVQLLTLVHKEHTSIGEFERKIPFWPQGPLTWAGE